MQADVHFAVLGTELDGVIDQGGEGAVQALNISGNGRYEQVRSDADVHFFGFGFFLIFVRNPAGQVNHIHRFELVEDEFHFLDEQDVVHQGDDLLDVAGDRIQHIGHFVGRNDTFLQHLQISAGGRERCAQVVGDIGQEIATGHFLLGQFLVGFGQFAGAHAQVINRHLVIFPQTRLISRTIASETLLLFLRT